MLKPKPKTVVNVKTQQEYYDLMDILQDNGWMWSTTKTPKDINLWGVYKTETCISIDDKKNMMYCDREYYIKKGYSIVTLDLIENKMIEQDIEENNELLEEIDHELKEINNETDTA